MIGPMHWRGQLGTGLFVVACFVLLVPASAFGSTVSRVVENGIGLLEYSAGAGEANDLTIVSFDDRSMTITDLGANIAPGDGCTPVDAHQVTCSPVDRADFYLLDGNDHADVTGRPAKVAIVGGAENDVLSLCPDCRGVLDGGPGGDTLTGSDFRNLLFGRTGNDTIAGRRGDDEISGGLGADAIGGGRGRDLLNPGSGNDTINGGTGRDRLSFDFAPVGVSVDLRAGTATNWGTKTLARIENVTGGPHGDILRGNRRSNLLSGSGGADLILGRGSEDRLFGGSGADRLRARDARRDIVSGGPGADRARVDSRDVVRSIESFF
jgi:Ca2+-binding RTX toxin-like protein